MTLYQALERRSVFIMGVLVFRFALEFGYVFFVNPMYSYAGFVSEPSWVKYVESWCLLLVTMLFVPWRLVRLSDCFIVLAYTGLIIPLLSLYALADHARWIVYAVLLQFFLVLLFRRGHLIHLSPVKGGFTIAVWLSMALIAGLSVWYVASGGIAYMNFDLSRVYDFRREAGEVIAPGIFAYVNPWVWKIFGPLLLAVAIWKRWWWVAAFVLMSHAFWFSVANHKSILFYPVVILAISYWFRRSDGLSVLTLGFAIVVVTATIVFLVSGDALAASLFVRRLFFVTANNTFDYYYFFSENAKVWWSSSSVSMGLVQQVYELNPPDLIGEWRGTGSHVNNSFLSTGYMHGGWWGLIVYGIIGGLVFRLVDSTGRGFLPLWVSLAAIVIPARSLVLSADLPTALLTHGIGLSILMMWLLKGKSHSIARAVPRVNRGLVIGGRGI